MEYLKNPLLVVYIWRRYSRFQINRVRKGFKNLGPKSTLKSIISRKWDESSNLIKSRGPHKPRIKRIKIFDIQKTNSFILFIQSNFIQPPLNASLNMNALSLTQSTHKLKVILTTPFTTNKANQTNFKEECGLEITKFYATIIVPGMSLFSLQGMVSINWKM